MTLSKQKKIENALLDLLDPEFLEVLNESSSHAGHSGDDGSGESHYCIKIKSNVFDELSRLERHKLIYSVLGDLVNTIHALRIEIINGNR